MSKVFKFLLIFLASNITAFSNPIQQSHLEANLPDTFEKFQTILDRDLQKHFSNSMNKNAKVKYELLRRGPTQSGLSYPKFYIWVNIYENDNLIDSGAVIVAAIEKIKVDVRHFVTKKEILRNPNSLETYFPLVLCDAITKKANNSK